MIAREFNFDGLVGPTHLYAGLSVGNLASEENSGHASRPRDAVRQGLAKMRTMVELGLPQAVIPPQERPDLGFLRSVGFDGPDARVLARAADEAPRLLSVAGSSSAMWTANAATVSPSADTADGRVHLTPANLVTNLHRVIETDATAHALRTIFRDDARFVVHDPLPATPAFADEGAANHTRLSAEHGSPGLEVFVYGREAGGGRDRSTPSGPRTYPARQTLEAGQAIARRHGLTDAATLHLRQRADAIDAGVFHNDVISVGNENVLLCHEEAFERPDAEDAVRDAFRRLVGRELHVIRIAAGALSVEQAVRTYLFNSQIVTLPDGSMALLAPAECERSAGPRALISEIVAGENPIGAARFFDLGQSMRNGGGPACLRLRVVLSDAEAAAVHPGVVLDAAKVATLDAWAERRYREELAPADLADPGLLVEARDALDELTGILGLADFYPFQR